MPIMVEHGANSRGQITGRSTQNKTVNFTCDTIPEVGSYVDVRITQIFPSSLVGEAVSQPTAPSAALLAQQALNARIKTLLPTS
jgi:tRNA-2-methylthio-N6-dimethylallyladenosine synthase